MSNIFEYKGYYTKIEFDVDDMKLHGVIEGISDFVNFEADNPESVEVEFHSAVDDYLLFCKDIGKAPDKTYKGSFNIRISPERHRLLAIKADKDGISLNAAVDNAIGLYLDGGTEMDVRTEMANAFEQYILSANYNKESGVANKASNVIPFSNTKYVYKEG